MSKILRDRYKKCIQSLSTLIYLQLFIQTKPFKHKIKQRIILLSSLANPFFGSLVLLLI